MSAFFLVQNFAQEWKYKYEMGIFDCLLHAFFKEKSCHIFENFENLIPTFPYCLGLVAF
jgi:hypothetical protein